MVERGATDALAQRRAGGRFYIPEHVSCVRRTAGPCIKPFRVGVLVCVQNAMIYRPGHRRCGKRIHTYFRLVRYIFFLPWLCTIHQHSAVGRGVLLKHAALEVSLARCVSLLSLQLQNNKLRPLRS